MLVAAPVVSAALSLMDVRLALLPLAAAALVAALRWFGVGRFFPASGSGWVLLSTILVTSVAPSLGAMGTLARVGMAAVCLVATVVHLRGDRRRVPRSAAAALGILLVALTASALAAPSYGFGLARLINWTMFVPLLFLVYNRPDVRGITMGIIGTGVIQMSGVGLQLAGLMGGTWGGLVLSGNSDGGFNRLTRYTSFVANPNNLALLLTLAVIACTGCVFADVGARLRALCVGIIPLLGFGIVLTGSRGGIIAVCLGLFVVLAWHGTRGWMLGAAIVGIVVAVAVRTTSTGFSRLLTSLAELLEGSDISANHRTAAWADRMASTDGIGLVLGTGFGGYQPSLFAEQSGINIDSDLARLATVDNAWLKLVLEAGFVGAGSMAALLVVATAAALMRSRGGSNVVGIATGASLVAMIWRSASVDMLDQNPWNVILFMAIGLALASASEARALSSRLPGSVGLAGPGGRRAAAMPVRPYRGMAGLGSSR